MVDQNRPLSAQDITTNLNSDLGKTKIASLLEKLATDKRIIEKTYGKQKIYMALQVKIIDCLFLKVLIIEKKLILECRYKKR